MKKKIDKFHIHEVLHLAGVLGNVIEKHLLDHPVEI